MSYCSECGALLMDDANFCHKCGVKQSKNNLINNIQKTSTDDCNSIDEQSVELRSRKGNKDRKSYKAVKIGVLIVLIILSVGFGSYYICSLKLSADNVKKTNVNVTQNFKNDSNNSETSRDKSQSNESKTDIGKNDIESRIGSSDNQIFPDSGDEKLLDSDLSSLSKEKLALVRNEIYARHGYIFETEPFKSYFNKKSWYKADSKFKGSDKELNSIEKYNLQLIRKYEKR